MNSQTTPAALLLPLWLGAAIGCTPQLATIEPSIGLPTKHSVAPSTAEHWVWQSEQSTLPTTHQIMNSQFIGSRTAGWSKGSMENWAEHLPFRLAQCGIQLGPVKMVLLDKGDAADYVRENASFIQSPTVLFVETAGAHPLGGASGGYTQPLTATQSKLKTNQKVAFVARRQPNGKKLRPEQTIVHEFGHLLNLAHTSPNSTTGDRNSKLETLTIMHPRGCLRCKFSDKQCSKLKAHPWVTPL